MNIVYRLEEPAAPSPFLGESRAEAVRRPLTRAQKAKVAKRRKAEKAARAQRRKARR